MHAALYRARWQVVVEGALVLGATDGTANPCARNRYLLFRELRGTVGDRQEPVHFRVLGLRALSNLNC